MWTICLYTALLELAVAQRLVLLPPGEKWSSSNLSVEFACSLFLPQSKNSLHRFIGVSKLSLGVNVTVVLQQTHDLFMVYPAFTWQMLVWLQQPTWPQKGNSKFWGRTDWWTSWLASTCGIINICKIKFYLLVYKFGCFVVWSCQVKV